MQQQRIIKQDPQTIFDVLLQHSGAISGLFDFMSSNSLTVLDIPEGEYIAPGVINEDVVTVLNPSSVEYPVIGSMSGTDPYNVTVTVNGQPFNIWQAGTTQDIVVKDTSGNILTVSGSGNDLLVELPERSWQRPTKWLTRPVIPSNDNCYWLLFALFSQSPNWLSLGGINWFSGSTVVEVYSDVSLPPVATITSGFTNLMFGYNIGLPGSEFRGYRQVWLKIKSSNGSRNTSFNIGASGTTTYGNRPINILEIIVSNDTNVISGTVNFGSSSQPASMLESVVFKNFKLKNISSLFNSATNLQNLEISPGTYDIDIATNAFNLCPLRTLPEGVLFRPVNATTIFTASNIEEIDPVSLSVSVVSSSKAKRIRLRNMSSQTFSIELTGLLNCISLCLDGYKVSHNITQTSVFGVVGFAEYANSLGFANVGGIITMTSLQYSSFGGSGSSVETTLYTKGWNIFY